MYSTTVEFVSWHGAWYSRGVCCLQEAQFEKLTRELEAERQSVATQLERVRTEAETTCPLISNNFILYLDLFKERKQELET